MAGAGLYGTDQRHPSQERESAEVTSARLVYTEGLGVANDP